jgi:hypothetical protein
MAKPTEAGETGLSTKAKAAAVRAQDKATEALDTVRKPTSRGVVRASRDG